MKRMKTLLHVLNRRNLPAACLTLAASICFAVGAGAPLPPDPSATLQRLQDQLDQQTKRVDRLYRALGPQLEGMEERAASLEKQQREDKELATELICKVEDESLTGIGCVNPAAAEFAVITDDGGVRIFDAKGKPVKELLQTDLPGLRPKWFRIAHWDQGRRPAGLGCGKGHLPNRLHKRG